MSDYFLTAGKPKIAYQILYFQNLRFTYFSEQNHIEIIFRSIRKPSANSSARYILEIIKFLRVLPKQNHKDWDS